MTCTMHITQPAEKRKEQSRFQHGRCGALGVTVNMLLAAAFWQEGPA